MMNAGNTRTERTQSADIFKPKRRPTKSIEQRILTIHKASVQTICTHYSLYDSMSLGNFY